MTKRERTDLVLLLADLKEMQEKSGSPEIFHRVIKYIRGNLFKEFRASSRKLNTASEYSNASGPESTN